MDACGIVIFSYLACVPEPGPPARIRTDVLVSTGSASELCEYPDQKEDGERTDHDLRGQTHALRLLGRLRLRHTDIVTDFVTARNGKTREHRVGFTVAIPRT